MAAIQPPAWLQNLSNHTAETDRSVPNALIATPRASNSLVSAGGVNLTLGGGYAVTQNGTPNMSVNVASGTCMVPGSEGAKQGVYTTVNDATVNVTITASDPTNPRIDTIVVRIRDVAYSGANNDVIITVVTGVAAGSPVAPTLPTDCLALADVRVNAGVTSILNANITDRRLSLTAHGGSYVCTSTTKPTLGLYKGFHAYFTDTQQDAVYDGTQWWTTSQNTAWTAYTPALVGVTLGTGGTNVGQFMQIGKWVFFRTVLTLGTGGALTAGLQIGLPVTGLDAGWCGSAFLFDASAGTNRTVGVLNGSTTSCQVFAPSGGQVGATNPFTWTVSDVVKGSGVYEGA